MLAMIFNDVINLPFWNESTHYKAIILILLNSLDKNITNY